MQRFLGIAFLALAVPAAAINSRSAVSVNGVDTNPCTVASPCRSFSAAIAQTTAGGEVVALDSAGYGPFTVPSAMMVSGAPGVHAALTINSGFAIVVNAGASDIVTIRNLILIAAGGFEGVVMASAAEVRVRNCLLIGFTSNAIASGSGRVIVDGSVITDSSTAIELSASAGGAVTAVVTDSHIEHCTSGIDFFGSATGVIANTTIVGSSGFAVLVEADSSGPVLTARAVIQSCTLAYNGSGVLVSASGTGSTGIAYLNDSTISYSSHGVTLVGGGQAKTYGNNRFPEVPTVGTLTAIGLQ
jgi:nitrous oxidase accessory protein NosD